MYCYHYKKTTSGYTLLRKTLDFVKDCQSNAALDFGIISEIFITDIDKDGYVEITYVYKLACVNESCVGASLKLIMLENGEKYAIRGDEILLSNCYIGFPHLNAGGYVIDPSFNKAPKSLLEFAKIIWGNYYLNLNYY